MNDSKIDAEGPEGPRVEASPSTAVAEEPRWPAVASGLVWVTTASFAAIAVFGALPTADGVQQIPIFVVVLMLAVILAYATVGALLILRRHGHPIGWLLAAAGLAFSSSILATTVGTRLVLDPGLGPAAAAIAWVQTWCFVLAVLLAGPMLMLVFPSGHLPDDRWRWTVWPLAAGTALSAVGTAFAPGPMADGQPMNPLGIEGLAALLGLLQVVGLLLFTIGTIGAGAALVARSRRSEGVEREQLKWFGFAAIVLVIALCVALAGGAIEPIAEVGYTVVFAALFCLPLAIGVAIMRYRLYEIDRLINRTLVYVPLTAIVAGGYAASVALLQRLFQALTGDTSDAAIVLSTLFLAAVFTPIRKSLEGLVDERFKPAETTPEPLDAGSPDPRMGDPWEARMEAIARRVVKEYLDEPGSSDL